MKKALLLILVLFVTLTIVAQKSTQDSVFTGENYKNMVFYSLEKGVVKIVPLESWDLAFQSSGIEAGIQINSKLSKLYLLSTNEADWKSIDTSGKINEKTIQRNSDESWTIGAFNQGETISKGQKNMGWGEFDMESHSVVGNKIYAINVQNKYFKKIQIISYKKGIYSFKISDLNGKKEKEFSIAPSKFPNKSQIYFSIINEETIDLEPNKEEWDLIFSSYEQSEPYPFNVTGIKIHKERRVLKWNKLEGKFGKIELDIMKSRITEIGSNWKIFNLQENRYAINDTFEYYASNYNGEIYKINFVKFNGKSDGGFFFYKKKLDLSLNEYIPTLPEVNFMFQEGQKSLVLKYPDGSFQYIHMEQNEWVDELNFFLKDTRRNPFVIADSLSSY